MKLGIRILLSLFIGVAAAMVTTWLTVQYLITR